MSELETILQALNGVFWLVGILMTSSTGGFIWVFRIQKKNAQWAISFLAKEKQSEKEDFKDYALKAASIEANKARDPIGINITTEQPTPIKSQPALPSIKEPNLAAYSKEEKNRIIAAKIDNGSDEDYIPDNNEVLLAIAKMTEKFNLDLGELKYDNEHLHREFRNMKAEVIKLTHKPACVAHDVILNSISELTAKQEKVTTNQLLCGTCNQVAHTDSCIVP